DVSAQQGIRFNIFQMNQTYTGEDERLNIGPKGFTGEKYGGSTYWDTEAYCLPFYLATAEKQVARNLLLYRYKHLRKAIENAEKLGFTNGAALYPMVTMNGEECHNEWEITFEEIHRNGAIAYAIHDYINYHGDEEYLIDYGLEVLIAISRFWSQRVNWSADKNKYVMLGVTGPNEYENNVNNNWYTSKMALWTLKYTKQGIAKYKEDPRLDVLKDKLKFKEQELENWKDILEKMYLPYDEKREVYLQQDGFLDKELIPVSELPEGAYPIHQNWSWDRILRSCFIKQADTLQGVYLFEDEFDEESMRRHFDFYEPMTVHESSLSPCVHSILAAKLGRMDKAYEMYMRTARLDLDDYNNDTKDGCHITSMAGTWMAFAKGFAGMRVKNGRLQFSPFLPEHWSGYAFKIKFREKLLTINVSRDGVVIENLSDGDLSLELFDKTVEVNGQQSIKAELA
ncbi:MAG: glycoside hydrolase family 65 protein, partial [Flavobacteriales bacterium]|nr:glycoside hydrolase family 65 protein [Flavobacteriales bacterium]